MITHWTAVSLAFKLTEVHLCRCHQTMWSGRFCVNISFVCDKCLRSTLPFLPSPLNKNKEECGIVCYLQLLRYLDLGLCSLIINVFSFTYTKKVWLLWIIVATNCTLQIVRLLMNFTAICLLCFPWNSMVGITKG